MINKMAEKGGDDKDNPFSFKNFVTDQDKKPKSEDHLDENQDDIFGLNKSKSKRSVDCSIAY